MRPTGAWFAPGNIAIMKISRLTLVALAACGSVTTNPKPMPEDAGATSTAPPPDAADDGCLPTVTMRFQPPWLVRGAFERAANPAGGDPVWRAAGAPFAASFSVPYRPGARITGLAFDAYGDGSPGAGLLNMTAIYQPAGAGEQVLVEAQDVGREPRWGKVVLGGGFGFGPHDLAAGKLWVRFDVTERGYYIGEVTATFERACP